MRKTLNKANCNRIKESYGMTEYNPIYLKMYADPCVCLYMKIHREKPEVI